MIDPMGGSQTDFLVIKKDFAETFEIFRRIDDKVIGFLLLNMHLHRYYCLHTIINSGAVLDQSIFSLSPSSVPCLNYLSSSSLRDLQKVFVQVNLHVVLFQNSGGYSGKQPLHPQSFLL